MARRAAARVFPADQVAMATAIAGAESSWNPTAVNKAAGGNYGLWQINSVHADLLRGRNWRTPETNAWMAHQVWDAADGTTGDQKGSWTPWSVYNSGSYRTFLRAGSATETGVPDTGVGDCVTTDAPEVRIGTWNVLNSNSPSRIAAGTRALTQRADVFGLQELGSPAKRAAAARGAVGFSMTTDRTAVPILYRTSRYTALAQGRVQAFSRGEKVERLNGKGTELTAAKYVSWVQLQDVVTSESFYVVNTHLLVGAQNSSSQRKANRLRVALYTKQLATLTRLTDSFLASGAAVYATCDCNVNYSADVSPVVTMRSHGLTPNWSTLDGRATHGRRYIDYVWSNQAPASQSTGGDRHGSDHVPMVVTFQSSAMSLVTGSRDQTTESVLPVTDPRSGRMFLVPIPTGQRGRVLSKALDQVGDTWTFGSHGPDAWDCSGLTAAAWRAAGVMIPAQSDLQHTTVRHVALADAEPGDIFWRKGYVSIYLGTVGTDRLVVGSLKAEGAVVIHPVDAADIHAVLRPTS